MGDDEDLPARVPLDDLVEAAPHPFGGVGDVLPTREGIRDRVQRECAADCRGQLAQHLALGRAEVDLAQPRVGRRFEPERLGRRRDGLPGAKHRGRPERIRLEVLGPGLEELRLLQSDRVDRQVGRAGVPVAVVPLGAPVAGEDDSRSHRRYPRRSSSATNPPYRSVSRSLGRGSITRPIRTLRCAVSATVVPPDAASTAIPYAGVGGLRQFDRYAEDVGAELVPVLAADRAAGQRDGSRRLGTELGQMLEGEPLDERDALQNADVAVEIVVDLTQLEPDRLGCDERESLAGLGEWVDRGVDRAVELGRSAVEGVKVHAGQHRGERAGAGVGRAAGEPAVAVGMAVTVDGAGRVVDEVLGDAFQDERRAEDRVPGAGGEGAGGDLRGAAAGHAGDDRCAGGDAGELGLWG